MLRYDYSLLSSDTSIKDRYNIEVRNRYEALSDTCEDKLDNYRNALVESVKVILPSKKARRRSKWITSETLQIMEERQKIVDEDCDEYKNLNRDIKLDAIWKRLNKKCDEVEMMKVTDTKRMHSEIKEISNNKLYCVSNS